MLLKLFLAFTLIPVAEIYVLIKLGGVFGALNTILLVLLTAFAGAYLAKMQGLKTMLQIRHNLDQGIMPAEEMVDALLIFAAGVVLLTPGFITDLVGLAVLFPPTRYYIKIWLRRMLKDKVGRHRVYIDHY
ncbi:MAG: FxsA family protein [Thermodesulfobacteriota bacterium]